MNLPMTSLCFLQRTECSMAGLHEPGQRRGQGRAAGSLRHSELSSGVGVAYPSSFMSRAKVMYLVVRVCPTNISACHPPVIWPSQHKCPKIFEVEYLDGKLHIELSWC